MFCPSCGTKLPDNSRFCFSCGAQTNSALIPPKQPPQKSITTAKLDTVSMLIIVVSAAMLLASLLLPLFELSVDIKGETSSYTLNLFGNNDMDGSARRDEIVTTLRTSWIFSSLAIVAVNVFSVFKKYVVQTLFSFANVIILVVCLEKIGSLWHDWHRHYFTQTNEQIGFTILFIGSFVLLALSLFNACKKQIFASFQELSARVAVALHKKGKK